MCPSCKGIRSSISINYSCVNGAVHIFPPSPFLSLWFFLSFSLFLSLFQIVGNMSIDFLFTETKSVDNWFSLSVSGNVFVSTSPSCQMLLLLQESTTRLNTPLSLSLSLFLSFTFIYDFFLLLLLLFLVSSSMQRRTIVQILPGVGWESTSFFQLPPLPPLPLPQLT